MAEHIKVTCRCGRSLRAPMDRGGGGIRCWDCQASVAVPPPKTGRRLLRECLDASGMLLEIESLLRFFAGGLLISVVMLIPVVGPALGFALLAIAVGLYPQLLGQAGRREEPDGSGPLRSQLQRSLAWGPLLALGLAAPVLLRHLIMDRYGLLLPWAGVGVAAVALVAWIALPLGPLFATTTDRDGRVPARRILLAFWRHPAAMAFTLLLIPVGVVALEAVMVALLIEQNWFGFVVTDLFPRPGLGRVVLADQIYDTSLDLAPLSRFRPVYTHGLEHGYSLVGALPASLSRGPLMRVTPWFPLLSPWQYSIVRALYSTLILVGVGLLLAIQARWLGLIATVDSPATLRMQAAPRTEAAVTL